MRTIASFAAVAILGGVSITLFSAQSDLKKAPLGSSKEIAFGRDIKPILERSCLQCHGPVKPKSGFRLDSREQIIKGGDSGEAAILPGNSEGSSLLQFILGRVKEMEMPPLDKRDKYPALSEAEIKLVRAWIDQGANWPEGVALSAVAVAEIDPANPEIEAIPPEVQLFFERIRAGDQKGMAKSLGEGVSIDSRDQGGNTPLIQAAFYLEAKQVAWFLEKGGSVNDTNKSGLTPLMKAASDLPKTRLLLDHGADVNARSMFGNTALIIASRDFGSAPVVKELLRRGASVTAANVTGANAIMSAVEAGDSAVLRILLDHRGDPNSKTRSQESKAEISALMLAAELGHLDCVQLLLDRGADLNLATAHGNALHFAAFKDRREMVRLFLDRGIDVNVRGQRLLSFRKDSGFTPLMYAAMNERNDPTLVEWLIEKGADLNATTSSGETALRLARLRGETKIVAALLTAGARDLEQERPAGPMPPLWTQEQIDELDAFVLRTAAERSVSLLVKSGARLTEATANRCASCHQQWQPALASRLAIKKKLKYPKDFANEQRDAAVRVSMGGMEWVVEEALPVPSIAAWTLIGLHATGYPADALTDNYAYSLARYQFDDGRWITKAARPPTDYSDVTSTALAIRALQLYAPPTMKNRFSARVAKAARWLRAYEPASTEERALQLLGLFWAGNERSALDRLKDGLLQQQRKDGGWSQIATLESDAYATGLSLYALHQAADLPASDPAYQRGVKYLLKSQVNDGSWLVRTRAAPVQVGIKDVFSHGDDQWISSAATSWAAMALMLAIPADIAQTNP